MTGLYLMMDGALVAGSTVPGTPGVIWCGVWNAATAYQVGDGVYRDAGSFRRIVAGTTATPPEDDAVNWFPIALRGTAGAGTGDVVGPALSIDSTLPIFGDTTGKVLEDSGVTIANLRDRSTHTGTQPASSITGLAAVATSGAASSLTGLAAIALSGSASDLTSGTLPSSVLPPLTITDVFPVASEAAMLALTAQRGDVALRTDMTPNGWFMLTTDSPSTLADWKQISTAGAVDSVNGFTGTVVLTAADVGAKPSSYVPAFSEITGIASNTQIPTRIRFNTNSNRATDPNTITDSGWSFITAATNGPEGATVSNYAVATIADTVGSNKYVQNAYEIGTANRTWRRTYNGAAWTAWHRSYTTPDIDALLAAKTPLIWDNSTTYGGPNTLGPGNEFAIVNLSSLTDKTITIPPDSTWNPAVGTVVQLENINTGAWTVTAGAGVTIQSAGGLRIVDRWAVASVRKVAANTWRLYGRTAT